MMWQWRERTSHLGSDEDYRDSTSHTSTTLNYLALLDRRHMVIDDTSTRR